MPYRAFLLGKIMKITFKKAVIVLSLLGVISSQPVMADERLPVGRYLTAPNQARPEQVELLNQTLHVRFPAKVRTVSDALHYLLRFSGYALLDNHHLPPEIQHMVTLPLPECDRNLGPITLQNALLTLIGQPFGMLVDPVHRLIGFRLLPAYTSLYAS